MFTCPIRGEHQFIAVLCSLEPKDASEIFVFGSHCKMKMRELANILQKNSSRLHGKRAESGTLKQAANHVEILLECIEQSAT